jgi:plasmid stabilization system protein ParE
MTFEIAKKADKAIKEIIAYYAENEPPNRAIKVLDSFFEAFQTAAKYPSNHPIDGNYHGQLEISKGVIHKTYIFKYKVLSNKIVILNIYHGKRNIN